MKKIFLLMISLNFVLSCNRDRLLQQGKIGFVFTHNWDGMPVFQSDFNSIKFTNANGEKLSIERLRYLISKITLTHEDGNTTVLDGYHLIDLEKPETLSFSIPKNIALGSYSKVSMTFGFDQEDNQDGIYPDLNSASWNVPGMLGGGYHFMQFDGKFIDQTGAIVNFNFHAIRAVDRSNPENLTFQNTFFEISLGTLSIQDQSQIEVQMNIAEWFKNPNLWDLNVLRTKLMPNFEAQIKISQNGRSVFSGYTQD